MITLITGTPGSGKTLYTVAGLIPSFEGRTVYVDGIADLTIDHQIGDDALKYHEWLPAGSVLVVDECQRIWRPRSNGSAVPASVSAMETHRHHGHDLVLITQHPNLIDPNIRRLVGRHLHVRRVWGLQRALIYEWDQATDPNRIRTATTTSWAYPKSAFSKYKSATVHTSRGQRPPFLLWVAIFALLLIPLSGWIIYNKFINVGDDPLLTDSQKLPIDTANTQIDSPASPPNLPVLPDFKPRELGLPLSAPAYDELRKIKSMPIIAACVSSSADCRCYTQQATIINMLKSQCLAHIKSPSFDPYLEPVTQSTVFAGVGGGALDTPTDTGENVDDI